jgi:hypothetical protein
MKKIRLNKTEREVIVKKVKQQILEKYNKQKEELINNYKPSSDYLYIEGELSKIKEAILNIKKSLGKDKVGDIFRYNTIDLCHTDIDLFIKNRLTNLRNLEINFPECPRINVEEMDAELVLMGISGEMTVEELINKLAEKYDKE